MNETHHERNISFASVAQKFKWVPFEKKYAHPSSSPSPSPFPRTVSVGLILAASLLLVTFVAGRARHDRRPLHSDRPPPGARAHGGVSGVGGDR